MILQIESFIQNRTVMCDGKKASAEYRTRQSHHCPFSTIHFVRRPVFILKTEQGISEQISLFESLYFSFRIFKRWTIDTVQELNRAQCHAASSERYRTVMSRLISLIFFVSGKQLFLGRKACKLPT
jgi:hypothetical protein